MPPSMTNRNSKRHEDGIIRGPTMTLPAGSRLGPYEILSAIGAGGMGEVYRARDTRLDRIVAVKVLPPHVALRPGWRDRFEREARSIAALNHPNICTLHDVGRDGDVEYLVMEYLDGETLAARLASRGPLPIHEAIAIAIQITDALDAAHRLGIVHRDLKPGNIILLGRDVRGPTAKLLDFGLAKTTSGAFEGALSGTVAATPTQEGTIVGTVAYMSPEQAEGFPLDARSDLFSLGTVLYEMLTGRQAFESASIASTLAAVLRSDPLPISGVRSGVPAALEGTVMRLLAKDRGARFTSAAQLKLALGSVSSDTAAAVAPAPKVSQPSLAVLAFTNLSSDPDNEYFAEGLAEEIIADLSAIRALRVISRASAMRFKSVDRHLPSVARDLGVRYVLQGSVRRAGASLRITAQLIDAEQDTNVWAEKYTGSLADVFGIQEEISRRIVDGLKVRLTTSEDRQIAARPIVDLRAYECYLRARQELYKWTPDSLDRAEALVGNALEIVGSNALLHATDGLIQWMHVNSGLTPEETRLVRAEECIERALALDPECGQAIFVRGIVSGLRGRLEEGVTDVVSAHERTPGDANVLTELSRFLFNAGQADAHRAVTEALVRVDPLTPISWLNELCVHTGSGRPEQAAQVAQRMHPLLDPASPIRVHAAWQGTLAAGRAAEARDLLHAYTARAPEGVFRSLSRLMTAAIDRDLVAAREHLTPALETAASCQEHLARVIAEAYAHLGSADDALRWLRTSVERGMINYPFLSRHDVFLEPIRRDPRFLQMMEAVKHRWEAFPPVRIDL
jgi:serine/threonine protein kinase/Tfp pilus assembly protein PilF